MKRSIVQQGPTTLMVSLPIQWVRQYNLVKGDEIEVTPQGRKLIISTEKQVKESEIEISIDVADKLYIWRRLQSAYISGYDKIKINFNEHKTLDILQELVVSSLIGFEITAQEKDYCILSAVSTELDRQFQNILRRIFLGILQMSEITKKCFENEDDLAAILNLELTNNRHTMFLKRILIKEGCENQKKASFYYALIVNLENIANEYKYLTWYVKKNKKIKISEKMIALYNQLDEELRQIYELFYTWDNKKVEKVILRAVKPEDMKILFKQDPEITHYLMKIVDLVRACLFQIAAIKTNGNLNN